VADFNSAGSSIGPYIRAGKGTEPLKILPQIEKFSFD